MGYKFMDDKDLLQKLIKCIDDLEVDNEEWSESKIDFLRKYGHIE
ncbi:hypothetical protein AAJ76_3700014464 [Vairimorpha ceranae]|uniref:Uncharacterized protein n=1 Tax=Vairimorpha ceranae TaxID=40302 RepID=A0A0F9ZBA6_9MICR|nr:hypothetical protein AAJ76_3700014464 [Vairimorpha ceranae]KKO74964.1 hypothetical protein AAJ76_3700014464 [Vairimorpha ceranae]